MKNTDVCVVDLFLCVVMSWNKYLALSSFAPYFTFKAVFSRSLADISQRRDFVISLDVHLVRLPKLTNDLSSS